MNMSEKSNGGSVSEIKQPTLRDHIEASGWKTVWTCCAAWLLAWISVIANSNSFAGLHDGLLHHACSTSGAYGLLGLGLSLIGVFVVVHPGVPKLIRDQVPNVVEMLGHLTTAGLGFAIALLPLSAHLAVVVCLTLFLLGWICFLYSKVLEIDPQKIEVSKSPFLDGFGKWLLMALLVSGVYLLYVGPLQADRINLSLSCQILSHSLDAK